MRLSSSRRLAVFALILAAAPAMAQTTYTVTATTDTGTGSGTSGDLRYCINMANALTPSGQTATIDFSLPANSTITLTNGALPPLNPGRNGALGANTNGLLIDGSTATNLTISGNNSGYGIFMAYSGNIAIQDLKLANGVARGGSGNTGGVAAPDWAVACW